MLFTSISMRTVVPACALQNYGIPTSLDVSIAGKELSKPVMSSWSPMAGKSPPPPPPRRSSSPASSTVAVLSPGAANWSASSPSSARSRLRKSPWSAVSATRSKLASPRASVWPGRIACQRMSGMANSFQGHVGGIYRHQSHPATETCRPWRQCAWSGRRSERWKIAASGACWRFAVVVFRSSGWTCSGAPSWPGRTGERTANARDAQSWRPNGAEQLRRPAICDAGELYEVASGAANPPLHAVALLPTTPSRRHCASCRT